jgi:tRNA(Ile)-lysidine synthase
MSPLPEIDPSVLPDGSGPLWVGFSGGLDSSVLLAALASSEWARDRGLKALHVDHGLHPASADWAERCVRVCRDLDVPLRVSRVKVKARSGGLEQSAREARYAAAAELMHTGDVLVTAHHLDDQAETFLLRALRGSGERGLGAMRPLRPFASGWLWRPLLSTPRESLQAAALALGLEWIEDPANAEQGFDRNFLRAQVLTLLRTRWPDAASRLALSARHCAEADQRLQQIDAQDLARLQLLDPRALSLPALAALPAPRRKRVLRHWLHRLGAPLPPATALAQIEQELLSARADSEAEVRWGETRLRAWRGALYVLPSLPAWPPDWQAQWDGGQPLRLPDGHRLELQNGIGERHPSARLPKPVQVRARAGGERIRLDAGRPRQSLKHELQRLGVPPWQRPHLPLLFDCEDQLIAAADLVIAKPLREALRTQGACLRWCGVLTSLDEFPAGVERLD